MADLIDRQQALGCFRDWMDQYGHEHTADEDAVYQRIAGLHAVQPEIIRCKDCKYFLRDTEYGYDWCNRMSGVFRMKPDDFCSKAERRTE